MKSMIINRIKFFVGLIVLLILSACLKNGQLRTDNVDGDCLWDSVDCTQSIVEQYGEYDLTFIEFTERGNLYNRDDAQSVLRHIDKLAKDDDGVAVFVFVHGWKHNANTKDSNVRQFREFLSRAAENQIVGKKKVVGLYLGWRGDTTTIPVVRNLSYWGRKGVAEEIGSGAVTEIFSQLHKVLVQNFENSSDDNILYKNNYVIIGHSFGGAIVLSALHDVMLKDLVSASPLIMDQSQQCQKIKRYADALVLLNPAIEANKAILLKEAASRCQFSDDQPKLMHVLSSDGDNATKIFFPIGQYSNIAIAASQKRLKRNINGKKVIINESRLNTSTVGNLKQFRTGYLSFDRQSNDWNYARCRDSLDDCGIKKKRQQDNHFPVNDNDPLSFIKTDKNFIKNHNDVFGCYVQSYITAIMFETQAKDKGYRNDTSNSSTKDKSETIEGCNHIDFNFKQCFNNQLEDYDCGTP